MKNRAVYEKYLENYAEPETRQLGRVYDHAVTIPAHQESAASLRATWSGLGSDISVLAIIVINSASAQDASAATLWDNLSGSSQQVSPGISLVVTESGPDLLLIDKFSAGNLINKKFGVGQARKVGCDIALKLHLKGELNSAWIYTTDADTVLPEDYFKSFRGNEIAHVYPFVHEAQDDLRMACALYDVSLLHYPAGLKRAGSPYG